MTNRDKIITVLLLFIISVLGLFLILKSDLYYSYLFNNICKDNNIYSVNTHNIENVNVWYKKIYKKGEKANPFLKKQFIDNTETHILFYGQKMKKSDIAIFLYMDINYDESTIKRLMKKYNFNDMQSLWITLIQNNIFKENFIKDFKVGLYD